MAVPPITVALRRQYEAALTGVYMKTIRVSLLDRQGNVIEDLTDAFSDGTLTVDDSQDVDRSVSLTIIDPKHKYGFDADTYQGGDLDLSRMVRVWWRTWNVDMADPVSTGVFCGPITSLNREGPVVTIEAQGKEVYGMQQAPRTLTIKKGAQRTDAIRTIARTYMGETRMEIPDLKARLGENLVVKAKDQPWKVMQKIAQSLGRQLFYDGNGRLVLRNEPGHAIWVFDTKPGGGLTSNITTNADLSEVINRVKFTGRTPKGKKQPVAGSAVASPGHPLSPQNLGPPGGPQYLTEEISNDHLRTNKECVDAAKARLERRLKLVHQTTFRGVPIPFLDPGDMVRVNTEYEDFSFRVQQFTLPLGLGGDMQVGYTARYRLKARRKKKRKK